MGKQWTASEVAEMYTPVQVEGLLGENLTVSFKPEVLNNFNQDDEEFYYGVILNFEDNTYQGFWFERNYWEIKRKTLVAS